MGKVALPMSDVQPAVLEADPEVVTDRQLGEHPMDLFHRNPCNRDPKACAK